MMFDSLVPNIPVFSHLYTFACAIFGTYFGFAFLKVQFKFYPLNEAFHAHFVSTYSKIGTVQRRLAWPLRWDDTQTHEAFHFVFKGETMTLFPE